MEILVVGAGAVGSVYGYYASRQPSSESVKITFLIKPKYRKSLEKGIQLYRWVGRKAQSIRFKNFSLVESLDEVSTKKWSAVLITLPSDKMRADGWLASLLSVTRDTPIWSLQPNSSDRAFISEKISHSGFSPPVVFGSIPIISYLAPMPGESFQETGYAFYLPPFAKATWSSKDPAAAQNVSTLFTSGGLVSKVTPENDSSGILGEALLRSLVAGLELSEWSFSRLLNGPTLPLVTGAIREMTKIQSSLASKISPVKDPGKSIAGKFLSSGIGVRTAMAVSRAMMPFDFESFLRVHFTKVDTQMHHAIDELIEESKKLGIPSSNLKLLRGRKANAVR